MQLLYTLTTYPPSIGGAQIHHHLLAQQMRSRHGVQVVSHWDRNRTDWLLGTTLKAPSQSRNYEIDGIPVHRLGFSWQEKAAFLPWLPLYYPWMDVALPRIARLLETHLTPFAHQADVIHNVRIGREGLSYASLQAARQRDIPFILTPVHHPRWVGWRYRAYNRLYCQADAVIALTDVEKQTLMALGVADDRIHITGIGPVLAPIADPHAFLGQYKLQPPIVLFLGQHYAYKGYQPLLEAAPIVWKRVPEAQFVFIGPAVKQSDRAFVGTDPRVHRLGPVDVQTKTNALAACTVLCVPSMQESFGGVYTEAWNFAKPVIGGQIPAIAAVITEGVDGFLVNHNPSMIAARLLEILLNPNHAHQMGQAGHLKVNQCFTWELLAQKTEAVYQKAMGC